MKQSGILTFGSQVSYICVVDVLAVQMTRCVLLQKFYIFKALLYVIVIIIQAKFLMIYYNVILL